MSQADTPLRQAATASPRERMTSSESGPWTVLRLIQWSTAYLEEKGIESPRLDAEHLDVSDLRLVDAVRTGAQRLHEGLDHFLPLQRRRGQTNPLRGACRAGGGPAPSGGCVENGATGAAERVELGLEGGVLAGRGLGDGDSIGTRLLECGVGDGLLGSCLARRGLLCSIIRSFLHGLLRRLCSLARCRRRKHPLAHYPCHQG